MSFLILPTPDDRWEVRDGARTVATCPEYDDALRVVQALKTHENLDEEVDHLLDNVEDFLSDLESELMAIETSVDDLREEIASIRRQATPKPAPSPSSTPLF